MSAEIPEDAVLAFVVQWYDPLPQTSKRFLLKVFVQSGELEMFDLKLRRVFLSKSRLPEQLTYADFFVGNKVVVHARELDIIDYGDGATRELLHAAVQRSVVFLTPDVLSGGNTGKVLDALCGSGTGVGEGEGEDGDTKRMIMIELRSVQLEPHDAEAVSQLFDLPERSSAHTDHLCSDISLAMILQGPDCVSRVQATARKLIEEDQVLTTDDVRRGMLVARDGAHAQDLTEFFFGQGRQWPTTATLDNCTCCVVKPHVLKSGQAGQVVDLILQQGYQISAMQLRNFQHAQATEFLEIYKGVVQDLHDHIHELVSGPCLCLEVRAEDAVPTFRETAGPWDIEMAREIRPDTIRANFGVDLVRNAVHCTDLPEDGVSECEYVFSLLDVA